jgi:DNA-binding LacI/PurR family transcriptional regulator
MMGGIMSSGRRRPTAADVARVSGVSTATVSYVLNRTAGQKISEKTRQKVLAAAVELGYVQHAAAQTLARGVSRVVLLDMSAIPHGGLADQGARAITDGLQALGYTSLLSWWGPDRSPEVLVQSARAISPAAVITAAPLPEHERKELAAAGVRAVTSLSAGPEEFENLVARAARTQVDFLAARGYGGVFYVPPAGSSLHRLGEVRRRAAEETAVRHGMDFAALAAAGSIEELTAALGEAIAARPAIRAVAAYNDEVAMRVLAALHRIKVPVPERIAVAGVDDLPLAEATIPALTTVRPVFTQAVPERSYLERLVAPESQVPHPEPSFDELIRFEVVPRDSA